MTHTTGAPPPEEVRSGPYTADIRWTTHGIPHITAPDLGSLGFGNGFAAARDNLCTIAESVLTVDGRRTQALGATQDNVVSDTFQGYLRRSGSSRSCSRTAPTTPSPGPRRRPGRRSGLSPPATTSGWPRPAGVTG